MKRRTIDRGDPSTKAARILRLLFILILAVSLVGSQPPAAEADGEVTRFAVITDYGTLDATQATVATRVDSWDPEFIVTAGDNWQGTTMGTVGSTNSYENAVGNYYGAGGVTNGRVTYDYVGTGNFYPVPGNHDFYSPIARYTQYFSYLPPAGSGTGATALYYDFVRGPLHFFMLNSGQNDNSPMPDQALQQAFLQAGLAASTSAWNIVMFHRPAYTGGTYHPSDPHLQWPFAAWGADFVIAGHNHIYERILRDGIRYFTAGASAGNARTGTQIGEFYYGGSGAMRVDASETSITLQYVAANGTVIDTFTQEREPTPVPTITTSTGALEPFSTTPGMPSTAQTYTVSGANLTGNISITAPDGFELSTNGSTYSSGLTLTQSGGTVGATTVYVRLTGAEGSFGGNIGHASAGAATRNVTVAGTSGWCLTVIFRQGVADYAGARDTHIRQAEPINNYGAAPSLLIDSDEPPGSGNDASALLYWDLSGIPAGSTVQSAAVTVYVENATTSPGYSLYDMAQAWTEGTGNGTPTGSGATWSTYDGTNTWPGGPGGASDKGSNALATFAPPATGAYATALNSAGLAVLAGWIDDPDSNKGFIIHAGTTADGLDFTSNEGASVANRPALSLTYCLAPAVPKAPVVTSIVPSGSSDVTLAWDAVTKDVNENDTTIIEYHVYGSHEPYFTTGTLLTPSPAIPTFTHVGGSTGATNWYYLVRAFNAAGESANSARRTGRFGFLLVPGTVGE